MKKASGDVIILNLHNKNIWCMFIQIWSATDIIFCHFRSFFALLPHYWPRKLKFGKIVKNHLKILSYYTCAPSSRSHDVWVLRYKVQRKSFLSFWLIFCLLTLLTTQIVKILKIKEKAPGDIIILHLCTKKWRSYDV